MIIATYFSFHLLRSGYQHRHEKQISQDVKNGKNHRPRYQSLIEDSERINDEKDKLFEYEDQQKWSKDSVYFFDKIQYQTVTLLPFDDSVAVDIATWPVIIFDIFRNGLDADRGEPSQREEQDNCETFVEFTGDDSQHFDSFDAAFLQFPQSDAVQSSDKLVDKFLHERFIWKYWS